MYLHYGLGVNENDVPAGIGVDCDNRAWLFGGGVTHRLVAADAQVLASMFMIDSCRLGFSALDAMDVL